MEPICISETPAVVGGIVTTVITLAAGFANFVKPDTLLGKIVHFIALNIKVGK